MRIAIQNKQAAATVVKSEEQKGAVLFQGGRGSREGYYKLESIGVTQEFEVCWLLIARALVGRKGW